MQPQNLISQHMSLILTQNPSQSVCVCGERPRCSWLRHQTNSWWRRGLVGRYGLVWDYIKMERLGTWMHRTTALVCWSERKNRKQKKIINYLCFYKMIFPYEIYFFLSCGFCFQTKHVIQDIDFLVTCRGCTHWKLVTGMIVHLFFKYFWTKNMPNLFS